MEAMGMVRRFGLNRLARVMVTVAAVAVVGSACYPPAGPMSPSGSTLGAGAVGAATAGTVEPVDRWAELLTRTPYSYTLPLPPDAATPVDGAYAKIDPRTAPHVHCLRCPDYMMEGGLWRLQLDHGVFRIYYAGTGWRSLGSYTLDADRLQLFNDPNCTDAVGVYTWQLDEGALVLSAVEDPCGQGLRAANLSDRPWLSCQPPNREAAITDHWHKPEGCDPAS